MLVVKHAVILTLAFSTAAALAQNQLAPSLEQAAMESRLSPKAANFLADLAAPETPRLPNGELHPRKAVPKNVIVRRPAGETRLVVKFRDDIKARALPNKQLSITGASVAGGIMAPNGEAAELTNIVTQFGLQFTQAITAPQDKIEALQARAAAHSGIAQPDLAGMMYVEGPEAVLLQAANALNALPTVEFAYFQEKWRPYDQDMIWRASAEASKRRAELSASKETVLPVPTTGPTNGEQTRNSARGGVDGGTDGALGACCLQTGPPPDGFGVQCEMRTQDTCEADGGVFRGPDDCDQEDCQIECGDLDLADCDIGHEAEDPYFPLPGCNDNDCCDLVGESRPFCTSNVGSWDDLCSYIANFICDIPPADRCNNPFSPGCFVVHPQGGCNDSDCCNLVCDFDPLCCTAGWDSSCVTLAFLLCDLPPTDPVTPDFAAYQGYLRASGYRLCCIPGNTPVCTIDIPTQAECLLAGGFWGGQLGGLPDDFSPPAIAGYNGEGMTLFSEGPSIFEPVRLRDDPDMPAPQRYEGLYGLGRILNETYGFGPSGAKGAGIKVAVIEWACYKDHEDLLHVNQEPNQTMLVDIPSATSPEHATACLGIIGAKDDAIGMVGIAPEAEMYFFPLTSAEEGPRFFNAFFNCYSTLGPGDVVSCSFGPTGNLNNEQGSWMLMKMGSDIGIATCLSAGNDCLALDELAGEDLGNSGAIVVGACTPGQPWCRLSFSNFHRGLTITSSRYVHCAAWGEGVAAPAYGDLTGGDDLNRAYTTSFGGTSAACPQVAGHLACLQGLAKQFYGIPLPTGPSLAGGASKAQSLAAGGSCQCGTCNPANLPGFPDQIPCGPDITPDTTQNQIGPYIDSRGQGDSMLSQSFLGFDDSPLLQQMFIIRGTQVFGNIFSIKSSDNTYLVTQMQYTNRNHTVQLPTNLPKEPRLVASKINYLSSGFTTDIMLRANTTVRSNQMQIIGEFVPGDAFSMVIYEMYDWIQGRWSFVNFNMIPFAAQGTEGAFAANITDGIRFINRENGNIYLRIYTLGIGNPSLGLSNNSTGSNLMVDWIQLTVGPIFGNPGGSN